jgi:hypothetical protein
MQVDPGHTCYLRYLHTGKYALWSMLVTRIYYLASGLFLRLAIPM